MNYSTYRFSLEIQSIQSQVSLPVTLGDTARRLYINLTDGGKPYAISEGCWASLAAHKADGKNILHDCIIEKNTTIRYDFTEQTATALGMTECHIMLFGGSGELLASPRFSIVVHNDVVSMDVVSEDDLASIGRIFTSEQARVKAEEERAKAFAKAIKDTEDATSNATAIANDIAGKLNSGYFDGEDGTTPHIGENNNWWIGNHDTGVRAEGRDGGGFVPYIGENNNWWIAGEDTGVCAEGKTPSHQLVCKYTEAGSYTWTCPEDGEYIALIVGGGGSGQVASRSDKNADQAAAGGGSGFAVYHCRSFSGGEEVPIVVGAGGAQKAFTSYYQLNAITGNGNNGGSSSFDGITANGGNGGVSSKNGAESSLGGQPSTASADWEAGKTLPPYGGEDKYFHFGFFNDERGCPVTMLCAGGVASCSYDGDLTLGAEDGYYDLTKLTFGGETERVTLLNFKTCSPGISVLAENIYDDSTGSYVGSVSVEGIIPTDCGAGGGGIAIVYNGPWQGNKGFDVTSSPGADGGVFIFKVRSEA